MVDEVYRYCKEHHESLIDVVKLLRERLDKKDNQICIEADTGMGKSVLSFCLMCVMAHMTKVKFHLEDNVMYMPKENELSKRLLKLKEFELLWVDETIKSLNKLRWHNRDTQNAGETIQTERFRHNTIIYCIPSFNDLTRAFKNVNIKFRIWCVGIDPARAILRAKEKQPDLVEVYGAWHTNERASYLREKVNPLTSVEEYVQL
jgi:hypothetical protein